MNRIAVLLILTILLISRDATATGILNGNMELIGGWVYAPGIVGFASADFQTDCEASTGNRGLRIGRNFAGTSGSPNSVAYQQFNCVPPNGPDSSKYCTITFSAKYSLAPGEGAVVAVQNGISQTVLGIPVTAGFQQYKISLLGCLEQTIVQFNVQNGNMPLISRLCIDDVTCECTDTIETSGLNVPTYTLVELDTLTNNPLPVDCNANGILDEIDILQNISLDVNQDGFPDECLPYLIPTLSQWGLILLTLLLLAFSTVAILNRQVVLAKNNGSGAMLFAKRKNLFFDVFVFRKTLIKVLFFVPFVLVVIYLAYGFITIPDIFGTFLSAIIVAYIFHFVLLNNEKMQS